MNSSDSPKKQPVPFGVNGLREDLLPTTPSGDNTASYDAGFPPITMILKAAGGLPPKGQDMNQILYELSNLARWNSAGAMNTYDSAFSTAISGYPKGAILANSSFSNTWLNTTEANTASPESSTTSGWVPSKNYGVTAITGLAAANVTLTSLQASNDRITLAGTLTANINMIFPSWLSKWIVTNNCTGNFTVTCKTSAGTGVAVPIGTTAVVFSDGTNITLNGPLMVQTATNSNHAVNLGQLTSYLKTSNNLSEIAAAGPAATAAARANLELGNAALKTVGNAAGNIPDMSFFTASNSTNGWQKLPSGLIIQWATSTGTNASGVANTTLPMQFPTAGLCALVTEGSASWAGNYCVVWGINALTTTSVTSVARNVSGTAGPAVIAGAVCKLLAIGY